MIKQTTLKKTIKVTGVGLHSGEQVTLSIHPAPVNNKIIFRRVDLNPIVEIPAYFDKVNDTMLCTSLCFEGVKVATVEHLLSAFAGLGIDNAYVDIDRPELPIMDGSAAPFVQLIQAAGVKQQSEFKRFIRILKPVRVVQGDKYAQFLPFNGYKLSFTIEFDHPVFAQKPKKVVINLSKDTYVKKVCQARTFTFLVDYEKLRQANLGRGGSFDNTIVMDDVKILNKEGLRFDNELVTHKVLDAIGDLSLLGYGLIGAFEGHKSGHELNNKLLHALMNQKEAWEYSYFDTKKRYDMNFSKLLSLPVEALGQ